LNPASLPCHEKADARREAKIQRQMKNMPSDRSTTLAQLLAEDVRFQELLRTVSQVRSDAWVAAGAVRNRVWNALFDSREPSDPDVDVVFFDATNLRCDAAVTRALAEHLAAPWQAVNQAAVHTWREVQPYASLPESLAAWPETATAVAVRLCDGNLEVCAPFGLDDLMTGVLRPTPGFPSESFQQRLSDKRFLERWPALALAAERQAEPRFEIERRAFAVA
jgi:hypothetical protein